ncbi:HAUS augmin-like complex subunit 2 [Saccoglossus kowalevskii]|uniref:Uncharacterized protein LOC102808411 n=1 Tax=Saccoglossus kowalevskii TaxID=10224 RepID=A0ABM0M3T1_SACKO|nr:PREDICTED: uncharacterized protein LOC102808411 [Saccoglossus kowalevskii]
MERFAGTPNPWVSENKSLGATGNVLTIAERTGHLKRRRDQELSLIAREHSPSLKLISMLKEIQSRRNKLYKIDTEVKKRLLDKSTQDITHLDVLEQKIGKLNDLSEHLQSVTLHKDVIINRLQQPSVGEGLKIEARYHQFVSGLFPILAKCLSELSSNLDNIEWLGNLNLSDGQLG